MGPISLAIVEVFTYDGTVSLEAFPESDANRAMSQGERTPK
jgi:hypothetical protein